jgi:hypothetical protein
MPCEMVALNVTTCKVDYKARDQKRLAVFLGER